MGAGSGRPAATPFGGGCGELLRADFGVELIGRQTKAGAELETAQRALASRSGGGGKAGAAVEPAIGSDPRAGGPAQHAAFAGWKGSGPVELKFGGE